MNTQGIIDPQPSCEDANETGLLPVQAALQRLQVLAVPIAETENLSIRDALGRVLAVDIVSPIPVPTYTNSAMDGYAVAASDIPSQGRRTLQLAGTAWAGQPFDEIPTHGQCVRIMTGAMMPTGTDTVVIQEHVHASGQSVTIDSQVQAGRNVRHTGEDVAKGDRVLLKGTLIRPAQLGLLASLGVDRVEVVRKPIVAYFTTGDELRSLDQHAGEALGPGELFDSNRYTLFGMLSRLGVETIDLGVVRDDREAIRAAFLRASERADLVLTSGGVSAGAKDFVTETCRELGEVAFWKLAMRPGRPLASGRIGKALFFGLPGNPVAVMVTFYELVQPTIRRLMGCNTLSVPTMRVPCTSALKKSLGRVEYQRGILENVDGVPTVRSSGRQGAGRLSSMCTANCMIVLGANVEKIEPGALVDVQLFEGMV